MSTTPHIELVRAANPGPMTLGGTNTWILRGDGGSILVDPGPADADHVARIIDDEVVCAVLTHRHGDHAGALALMPSGLPVFSADPTLCRHTTALEGGEVLRTAGFEVVVIATPGHTDDSICLRLRCRGVDALLTGDTLLGGRRSTMISRHTGSLAAQLRSLQHLTAFHGVRGLPGHGDEIPDVGVHAAAALAHRRRRLDDLERRMRADPDCDFEELVRSRLEVGDGRFDVAVRMLRLEADHLIESGRVNVHAHSRDPITAPVELAAAG